MKSRSADLVVRMAVDALTQTFALVQMVLQGHVVKPVINSFLPASFLR